jgi:hypothetical protein
MWLPVQHRSSKPFCTSLRDDEAQADVTQWLERAGQPPHIALHRSNDGRS